MNRSYLIWGFSLGLIAVILGAFGAHALEKELTAEQLDSYQTGVRYQMYHAILLVILANYKQLNSKVILYFLTSGILLFSFSIYLLSCRELLNVNQLSFLGPITPIGGSLLIFAWAMLLFKAINLSMSTN